MSHYVQSVVVQGRVYVGGGEALDDNIDSYIVMEYDIGSGNWTKLPLYEVYYFALTVINNQLVLVGGWDSYSASKVLGVWRAESTEWTHPYPDMPTARSSSSAVVYNEWLVVAGGYDMEGKLSTVEVMNTDTNQWFAGPPTPIPWMCMKTAIVGDTCYCFMGGPYGDPEIYYVSLPVLISSQDSKEKYDQHQIWKTIPKPPIERSAPLSINGYLLSVGGKETSIYLYQPDTGEWVKVGNLPGPRRHCTCAIIAGREMIVAGGYAAVGSTSVFIGHLT